MNWDQFFSMDTLINLGLPVGIGILVAVAVYLLRRFLYKYIHKLAAKTATQFDDIMLRETRLPTFFWCIWLGIYVGFTVYTPPDSWAEISNKIIPVLFVAMGIYTVVMVLIAVFKWYKVEICAITSSRLDDVIMGVLIFGTPVIGAVLGAILILNMLGYQSPQVNNWLGTHGPKLGVLTVVIVVLLLSTVLIVPKMIDKTVRNARSEQTEEEMKKRSDTLVGVIVAAVQVVLIFMFVLMVLTEIGINVTAVLTGAGVVGLAIGFGAQSLVKDVIAGLFVIMENQYRKGDVISIAGQAGVVEDINLRRTILRDLDGIFHVIPNGEIRVASNYTKIVSRVNLNVSVSYDTDLDKAIAVIDQVGQELASDPRWSSVLLSVPKSLRVDKLGDSGIDIKITADTKPSQQWAVTGELRLRVKKAFDKAGIEIPFPHTKVVFGNPPPDLYRMAEAKELPPK
jgi:small-conductance mechanosensitive channel